MADIIIADDHEVIRTGLKLILDETPDLEITDFASSGNELIQKVKQNNYDAVVLDISMEGKDVFDTLIEIKVTKPELPVIIFSMNPEEQYAVRLIKSGASGYVNKSSGTEELITALRSVLRGETYLTPVLSDLLVRNLKKNQGVKPHESLSNREFQIMTCIANGMQLTEISEKLFLSKSTVSNHRTNILKKLGLKNNADIAGYALKNKIIE